MAIKLPKLDTHPKTESGATPGSTGDIIDRLAQIQIERAQREALLKAANEAAEERRVEKQDEEGSGRVK